MLPGGQSVPLASFPPGDYRMEIKITDAVAKKTITRDIHCVTTWSQFDMAWEGVAFFTIADLVKPKTEATHVFFKSYDGYSTNNPLEVCMERNRLRARVVPEEAMRKLAARLVPPSDKPAQLPPGETLPVPGEPKSFHWGTGPSSTRATLLPLLIEIAAKVQGSLKTSGLLRSDTCDNAAVPSRQIMPAPMPPMGKAMRLRRSPEYSPLYLAASDCVAGLRSCDAVDALPPTDAQPCKSPAAPTTPAVAMESSRNSLRGMDEGWSGCGDMR